MGESIYINPLVIFFASILTSNMVLANFLGMCSYISVSNEYKTASGLGKAVTFVMAVTTVMNFAVYKFIIIPLGLEYLRYIVFILVIAASVQVIEMVMDRYFEGLYIKLGIFLPLITVNCAILGISLFMVIREYDFIQALFFGLGSGLGFWLAISALAAIKEKMAKSKLPKGLEGPGITFIITGIIAMAFIGFSGIFQIQ